jgi:hypothetical protein
MGIRTFLVLLSLAATPAFAAPDPAEGKKLVAEKACETCHHNKTMGDAKAVYLRKDRKVTSMEKLKAQVALCNSELNLQLFPEEEEHVAAYLDETYYKFGLSSSRSISK